MEDQSEPEPEATQGRQHAGKSESGQEERGGENQSPATHRPAPHQGPEGKNREHDREGESKGPVRRAGHHLVDDKPLVSSPRAPLHISPLRSRNYGIHIHNPDAQDINKGKVVKGFFFSRFLSLMRKQSN